MQSKIFDFAIIGAGAAGLHLALAMAGDPYFQEKEILLLEKEPKDVNDRTWCFWEKGSGQWDHLLRHSWSQGDFFSISNAKALDLAPYRYKMLSGIDFYRYAKKTLAHQKNIIWQTDEVHSVGKVNPLAIQGAKGTYKAVYVFDSRIPAAFFEEKDKHTRLLQHFRGWLVRTPDDRFDPSRFTMMDFRLVLEGTTSFTYLLPLSSREALVEFTLFSPQLLDDGDYDQMLRHYINGVLKINDFEIMEVENGVIPMSDFPFDEYATKSHVLIGTAGGWVKPSSGYAFKNCERNAQKIVKNIKVGKPLMNGLYSKKFRFYDAIFLGVLSKQNGLGPSLFEAMYLKNSVQSIFTFLDEASCLREDLRIIKGFPKAPFLRSLAQYITS